MKLAAIDIGSNAIRLQITTTIHTKGVLNFKKLEYVRFPLRLGHDVFKTGEISPTRKLKFKKLMKAYKLLIDLYEVDDIMACATSAMREAKNGRELVKEVEQESKLVIKIIDGAQEAILINNAISGFLERNQSYVHIDVGGGSTELTIIKNGIKMLSKSFKIGSVRRLEHHDSPIIWKTMEKWVRDNLKTYPAKLTAVGTGGNINKLFELAGKVPGDKLTLTNLREVYNDVKALTWEERINELQLNPDRADVIVPAAEIYMSVMEWAATKKIIVPDVGLKDGIMHHLYEKNTKQEKIKFS